MNFCATCQFRVTSRGFLWLKVHECSAETVRSRNYVTGQEWYPRCYEVRKRSAHCLHYEEKK